MTETETDINDCNFTINDQQYYTESENYSQRVTNNLSKIRFEFFIFGSSLCCCIFMSLILLILIASRGRFRVKVIITILIFICCSSAVYYYYSLNNTNNDLENISTEIIENKNSRPCRDAYTGSIIN
jgi:glucan phosphoethanolaminetransferase (alkaline phosphatase superfamily)